ncbi:transporter substrate-binding domain-containing protein [Methylobrevis pamukkalensis]|uniref:Putative ABC transporter arginine-binding protein 2 n=1 Tax=Methylobrevis pamukkalensis TaxID=1439726 RepID=A0A1E3GZ58_9HYPH|nr:transporter substrate-binding domain-containing protein [Methylobrevis pamukkalensis]ODN68591.1 putative ABC transporter arginine-binding protein 2 precursor [Methylobrevis pamukkalensis]
MSFRVLSGLLLAAILLGVPALASAGETLRVATEGAYPPFNHVDGEGRLTGFDVDIARAICADMKVDCSFVAVPWDALIDGLVAGDYDLIAASMAYTPERAERIAFSDFYYRSHSVFIGDASKIRDTSPAGLAGRRIAVAGASIQSEYLARFYAGSEIRETSDSMIALEALMADEVDVVLGDAVQILSWMEEPAHARFEYIGDPVTGDYLQSSAHIAARKDSGDLLDRVNAAIRHIRLDGTYERINNTYFPFSIY